ncbi:MAG: MSHA biogenesis protein MshM (Pilus type IV) [uncultured bacterium]|nr:MAG: MSHA biogenesis protein MshM (Pilus type IV) [uncultured bacterium]
MSMYQEHFKLAEPPFSLTPDTRYFYKLTGHHDAFNTLMLHLHNGEGFIKITGEIGSGKTLLCRMLLEQLDNRFLTAYIPNPDLEAASLRKSFARELGIDSKYFNDQYQLLSAINEKLIELRCAGKQVVIVIDEAQALPTESLETLRLLANLETKSEKLLQIVLFGQTELDSRLNQGSLRQLKQRISFSSKLGLLKYSELKYYIAHRLHIAGYHNPHALFTKLSHWILFNKSKGIPRLINIFCHKALMSAYGRGKHKVTFRDIIRACNDTEFNSNHSPMAVTIGLALACAAAVALLIWRFQ